ncbi:MAG TPA: hypothetical protein VKP12_04615, partial [Kiloniellaceae bacterium]|nr:hypothetical protein [Kiloniellaceae bacterium]
AAEAGVFFSEVCTVALSSKSAFLCRQIGMRLISQYQHRREDEVGDVFHLDGPQIADVRLVATNRRLAEMYRKRFAVDRRN